MARRRMDPREAAEAAFKPTPTQPERMKYPVSALPKGRETVSLRIDHDVLDRFQEDGPGWQERINAALRRAAGL